MRIRLRSTSIFFWSTFFIILFPRMISLGSSLEVGHENIWSDWALHIGLTSIFQTKSPSQWFAYHPIYADGKLTYAFLVNLISGMMMRAGFSLPLSFIIPSIIMAVTLVIGIHRFLTHLLRSEKKAVLAVSIFFFSAGTGFWDWFVQLGTRFNLHPSFSTVFEHFTNPPEQYSKLPQYQWGTSNWVVGHLLPQRAFLLGMMLAVWSMLWVFQVLHRDEPLSKKDKRLLIFAGISVGLLPIAHMHSFIASVILMGPMCAVYFRRWKSLLYYVVPAGVISTALYFKFVHAGIEDPNFMHIRLGYTANGVLDWFVFWLRAWGPTLPLAALGVWVSLRASHLRDLRKTDSKQATHSYARHVFYAMGFFLFFLCNTIYFQPISWDNTKLFLWVYFLLSALASEAVFWIWNSAPEKKYLRIACRALAAVLIVMSCFTGLLELIKLQRVDTHTFALLGPEEIQLAYEIREKTDPLARFMTAPEHNHPITVLGARPILMGYLGWVWNFGFLYGPLEHDIEEMYKGTPSTLDILKKHKVSYVYIGPAERNKYHPDETFFAAKFPVAFSNSNTKIYDVRSTLAKP